MRKQETDVIEKFKVVVTWRNDIQLVNQISSLRKICPELNNLISSEFLEFARSTDKVTLGHFVHWRVGEIMKSGQQLGLIISVED
jgi:hypothetical protein